MFGRLFKKQPFVHFPDHFALTDEVMQEQLCRGIEAQAARGETIFVLCHFPSTFEKIQSAFDYRSFNYEILSRPVDWTAPPDVLTGQLGQINLSLVSLFSRGEAALADSAGEKLDLSIMVCERHPLPAYDAEFQLALRKIPHRIKLGYYQSLDHPVLRYVINETMINLLKQMGLSDHDLITSDLVCKRINSQLKKLEQSKTSWEDATSPEGWFDLNLPNYLS